MVKFENFASSKPSPPKKIALDSQFLNKLGFTEISETPYSVNPPKSCPYWDKPVMIIPTVIK